MFLNKRNIINVSISRAKDYLFIVMPDDDTEGISKLRLVKRVEHLIQSTDDWSGFLSPELETLMFEIRIIWKIMRFLQVTRASMFMGLPESRYEVRTEDNAIDVQIHRAVLAYK